MPYAQDKVPLDKVPLEPAKRTLLPSSIKNFRSVGVVPFEAWEKYATIRGGVLVNS